MKAYYARPISVYGTAQEARDIASLATLGIEVVQFPESVEQDYKQRGMEVFFEIIAKEAQCLFFRAAPHGRIPAGVGAEIAKALEKNIPIFELPSCISYRTMSVQETRDFLKECGKR